MIFQLGRGFVDFYSVVDSLLDSSNLWASNEEDAGGEDRLVNFFNWVECGG